MQKYCTPKEQKKYVQKNSYSINALVCKKVVIITTGFFYLTIKHYCITTILLLNTITNTRADAVQNVIISV